MIVIQFHGLHDRVIVIQHLRNIARAIGMEGGGVKCDGTRYPPRTAGCTQGTEEGVIAFGFFRLSLMVSITDFNSLISFSNCAGVGTVASLVDA